MTDTEPSLANQLWGAANILRGAVNAADLRVYVSSLLFLKCISDVYTEERVGALAESGGDEEYAAFPEQHRFQLPAGCRWDDLRERSTHVGQAIQRIMREIENANPDLLYGIFGDVQWANHDRLSDARLGNLVDYISDLDLSNKAAPNPELADAYDDLLERLADQTNRKAGQLYTPRPIVNLAVNILDPQLGETIYDPYCGTAGMLLGALNHVTASGGDGRLMRGKLFGREENLNTVAIARTNLFLHGAEDHLLVHGDQLTNVDCVLTNPPPQSSSWLWVQDMLSSLAPKTGRMAVVLPDTALVRRGLEGKARRKVLELDMIEMVLSLDPNLFYGPNISACVVIFQRNKLKDRRDRILFINGNDLFQQGRKHNILEPEHVAELLELYRNFSSVEGRSRVISLDKIQEQDGSLDIDGYVTSLFDRDIPTLEESTADLKQALDEVWAAEAELERLLADRGQE